MSRIYTWKALGAAVGLILAIAIACVLSRNNGMASSLVIVAILEAIFGALVITVGRAKHKRDHSTTP